MLARRWIDNRSALALLFFVLVLLLLFWPFVSCHAFLWNDFAEYTFPAEVFAARSVAQGITPWWNPYTLNGMPFIADPQVGFFYPPNQLMYQISRGTLTTTVLQNVVVLHYLVAMV